MLIRGFWRLSSPSQNSGGKSLSAFVWALCLVSFGVQYSYFLVLQLQDIAEKMMVVFTFVPQLVCKFLLRPNGPKYEDTKPQSVLPQLFWFQTLQQIVEPGYMKSLWFTQDVCRWCWPTRSHSKFIPEALDGVEVRALCRPVKVFHSEIQGESSSCNTRLMNVIFCCNSLSYTLLPQSWRKSLV